MTLSSGGCVVVIVLNGIPCVQASLKQQLETKESACKNLENQLIQSPEKLAEVCDSVLCVDICTCGYYVYVQGSSDTASTLIE